MTLPPERKVQSGKTYDRIYDRTDYDPVEGPYRSPRHLTDWIILAILIVTIVAISFGVL